MSGAQKNTVFGPVSQPYAYAVTANINAEGSCGVSTRSYAAGSVHDAPAGWFMKAWSLEAPAEVAAPDIS